MQNIENLSDKNFSELLNLFRGKECTLTLTNGNSVTGIIFADADYTKTLTKLVRIEKIAGKDMYDMIVPKEHIIGVSFRRPEEP